ncbi:MAG: hypothetical protein JXB48_11095 [Candidatus Latescibacteria bacterium]|nr:hypothetical protein [Candidatus Latescibacterota bacterium]
MFIPTLPGSVHNKTLGDFLPYVAVTRDFIVSQKPAQLTAVIETRLSELDEDDVMQYRHDQLMNVLCDIMPPDSTLSIYLTKRFISEKLPYRTACSNSLIEYLDRKTIDTYNSKTYPLFACFFAITIPVVSLGSFSFNNKKRNESITSGDFAEAAENLDNLLHALTTRVSGTVFRLKSRQILGFLSVLLNHQVVNTFSDLNGILSGDFNSTSNALSREPGYVYYGGDYHSVLSLRSVGSESRLPTESSAALNKVFYGSDDLKGIPFTIHHSIRFISKQRGLTIASLRRNSLEFKKGLAKTDGLSIFAKTEEGVTPDKLFNLISESLSIVENSNHKFVHQFFQIHLWHDDLDSLWRRVRLFRNSVSSSYLLKTEKYNIKPAFYSLLPGNESVNKITSMLATYTVADFMPIDLPRECLPDPDKNRNEHIYFQTSTGSIARLCVFSSLANAHNAMICGGTGSGKSFLMNSVLYQSQASFDPIISIIDVGGEGAGSYRNFVLNNNGTYIEITSENPFSINPFDGPFFTGDGNDKKPIEIRHEALLNIISRMVGTKDNDDSSFEPLPSNVMFHLDKALVQYFIDSDNNEGNVCNLHDFAENYLKDNGDLLSTGHDLYKALAPFIGQGINTGIYAAYFRRTDTIRNPNVVCFDLMGLASRPRLAAVLIPTLLEMIMRNVSDLSVAHRRKLVVVDEAWKFLKGGSIASFIEQCFATIRKNNGSISILTQNLQTVADSPIAGSLFLNTSYYYLVGGNHVHDPDDNPPKTPLLHIEAKSSHGDKKLTAYDVNEILSQKRKGLFYLLSPFFCGKLMFNPTVEFTMLSTTHPPHKIILDKYKKRLGTNYVTPEVLEAARDEFIKCLHSSQ